MRKIKEVIVVEGRYDKNTLAQVVDATVVTLGGFAVFNDKEKVAFLRRLAAERGLSRLTLEVLTDDQQTELLCNQLSKMVPVHSVRLLAEEHSIRREMVLCKVRAEERSVRSELIQLANVFRASILDVSSTSMTLAVIGEESKNEALTDLLREFGILEMVRTGMVALERGRYTIQDERKETLEFNLGKML